MNIEEYNSCKKMMRFLVGPAVFLIMISVVAVLVLNSWLNPMVLKIAVITIILLAIASLIYHIHLDVKTARQDVRDYWDRLNPARSKDFLEFKGSKTAVGLFKDQSRALGIEIEIILKTDEKIKFREV